jgi:nicotinate-nucleotide pyrophosphorylase (carboxylating)
MANAADFRQIEWDADLEDDCRQLIRLAIREDLERSFDWTTVALVPPESLGSANVAVRSAGVIAGLPAARLALSEYDSTATWTECCPDGSAVAAGQAIATMAGAARHLLTAERVVLNLLGRLSGIATLTRRYVDAVAGTAAVIYDTRKTTPGWRRLEKYAVRCGGGRNHRTGLYDAVLIKDNHLAFGKAAIRSGHFSPADAVVRARQFLREHLDVKNQPMLIEVEVDTLEQFAEVLGADPDLVLLDNMPPDVLRQAVRRRNQEKPQIRLEASGGVNLSTVRAIAESGVDRISVGALTHSAVGFDVGLDWQVG